MKVSRLFFQFSQVQLYHCVFLTHNKTSMHIWTTFIKFLIPNIVLSIRWWWTRIGFSDGSPKNMITSDGKNNDISVHLGLSVLCDRWILGWRYCSSAFHYHCIFVDCGSWLVMGYCVMDRPPYEVWTRSSDRPNISCDCFVFTLINLSTFSRHCRTPCRLWSG
jgi:hypothetical protein